ncbi:MAG: response regulator transcription factor [Bacteroidales bacterium]|jgi:two-component system alkaline phosphatase synthesis response regulator PhoP|nr:response regulator transcription factor [Bacteroidales bacterium]
MGNKPKILIVDDEQDLREILEFNLSSEEYEIDTASSAEEALTMQLENYQLILLDIMMGGITGFRMADIIRKERGLEIPIIFLTAKDSENDLLTGFNVGADDYITKPFSIKEVIVRVKAILKRGQTSSKSSSILECESLKLDIDLKSISIANEPIKLTRKEFDILVLLMKNKGKYLSREEIMNQIWSDDVIVTERNVDVNIARLRKKINEYGTAIKGRSGYGYCFDY